MKNDELLQHLETVKQVMGGLNARTVVAFASDPESPLHGFFEWDPTAAAQLYREKQARGLIQRVSVSFEDRQGAMKETRAFVVVRDDIGGLAEYESLIEVMSDDDKRERLLQQAKQDIDALVAKYKTLQEFAGLMATAAKELAA